MQHETPALYCEFLLGGDRDTFVGDVTKRRLVFWKLARVTTFQVYIAVQNVQDTLAYSMHQFFVTL